MEDCEKITDWSIGHLREEEEEDDDEDYDDDPYAYDDAPATYDVAARLKEINAALSKQIIPDESDQCGHRRVKFHDNPVAAEIPPDTHFDGSTSDDDDDDEADDEDEEEDEEEDDGYGDSTEVSDEPEDFSSTTTTTTTTSLDVVKSSSKRLKSPGSESLPLPPNVTNPSIEKLALKLANLVSTEAIKWHSCRQTTDVDHARQPPLSPTETNTSSGDDATPVEVNVIPITHVSPASNIVEVSQSPAAIERDHVSSRGSNESVDSFEEPSEEQETKDEPAAPLLVGELTDSATSAPIQSSSATGDDVNSEKDLTAETTRVLETRPSTRPVRVNRSLKHSTVEETMVMSSEGKFHIVSMDDFRRTSSAFGGRPSTRTTTLPRMSNNNVTEHPRRELMLSQYQRLTLAYMGSSMDNKTLTAKNGGKRPPVRLSRPSTAVILADARSHQRVNGRTLGRASYGLTAEQKEDRDRRVMETASQRRAQHERAMEETKRRKERGEVAFREWLRLKKQNQDLKPTECNPGSPAKNAAVRTSNTECEESGSAFREWLHRKRIQKEENRRLEELRLVHEQEMYSKKTREENEIAFKEWLLRKTRRRSSHCGYRGQRFGIGHGNGHQFNGQHRKAVTQLSQKEL